MYIVVKEENCGSIQKIFQSEKFDEAQSYMIQDFSSHCMKNAGRINMATCKMRAANVDGKLSGCSWQIIEVDKKDLPVIYIAIRHVENFKFVSFAEANNAYDARQAMLKNFESWCDTYDIEHLSIDDQYYVSHDQSNFDAQFDGTSAYVPDYSGGTGVSWAIFGI